MLMALGMLEVFGFTTSIGCADAIAKAGNVQIIAIDKNKPAAGDAAEVPLLMTIKFTGDVSDVEMGMEAGRRYAEEHDLYNTSYIIAREAEDTHKLALLNAVGRDKLRKPRKQK